MHYSSLYDIIGYRKSLSESQRDVGTLHKGRLPNKLIMALDLKTAHRQLIEYLESRRRARATIVAYSKDIEQLVSFLANMGKRDIGEVTRDELEAFLKKLKADNYTPKSVSRKINSMKTFYRFLKSAGAVNVDPTADIEHPKYEVKPPRVLSKLEYRALRDACRTDPRTYAVVELFLQTGIRIGELATITLDDIKENELHIPAQEGHGERSLPLNKAAKEALDRYLVVRGDSVTSKSLFITKTGRALLIRNIRTAIDRYFRVAGIENAKVNDLRHTFIFHHLMAGTPITSIQKLVGHKRLSTTEKYLELVKDKPKENVKLEEL